jgi:hypothetical protein
MVDPAEVNRRRRSLSLISDDARAISLEIDRYPKAPINIESPAAFVGVNQKSVLIKLLQFSITGNDEFASSKPELVQGHSSLNEDGERLRNDFDVQRSMVTSPYSLKFVSMLGNQACKDIESSSRTLWVCDSENI